MADTGPGWQHRQMENSAIIDMQNVEDDSSDYDTGDSLHQRPKQEEAEGDATFMDSMRKQLGQNVSTYVWKEGSQRAKKAFSLYGNIDILRPYFDVEPHQVRSRLLFSLFPALPSSDKQKVYRELYGPLMVVFTMIALLLFQMKSSGHTVQEGTLMGTAIGTCFLYWIGGAWLIWILAYICNTHIAILQLLSMLGYGLFGHCIVLFLGTVIHTSHDHVFFYVLWAAIGGLSTLKMVSILVSRTTGGTQKLIICGVLAAMHMLFLIYLHFAYHQIVEELSEAFDSPGNLKPKLVHQSQEAMISPVATVKLEPSVHMAQTMQDTIVPRIVHTVKVVSRKVGMHKYHNSKFA